MSNVISIICLIALIVLAIDCLINCISIPYKINKTNKLLQEIIDKLNKDN